MTWIMDCEMVYSLYCVPAHIMASTLSRGFWYAGLKLSGSERPLIRNG